MNINDMEWHDGLLREIHMLGSGEVLVICELYPDYASAARIPIRFQCSRVKSAASLIDFAALLDNQQAGNINNGCIETRPDGDSTLKIFLNDGYLEIIAAEIRIDSKQANG